MRPDPEWRPTVVDAGGGDGMDDGVALEAGEGARRPGTQSRPIGGENSKVIGTLSPLMVSLFFA